MKIEGVWMGISIHEQHWTKEKREREKVKGQSGRASDWYIASVEQVKCGKSRSEGVVRGGGGGLGE